MASDIGFIAGATGLTGRHVAEHLVSRGATAIAHVRPDSPRLEEWRGRFAKMGAEVDTTPWREGEMTATFASRSPGIVFACLGTTRARGREAKKAGRDPSAESYDAVDVALTEMLIHASCASGVHRFVYLSSTGAGEGARGSYLEARTRVERALRESGVPYTIVRPSFILGEREKSRASENVFGAIADAGLSLLGAVGAKGIRDRYHSISGDQLARAMVELAFDPKWENRIAEGDDLQAIVRASEVSGAARPRDAR